MARPILGLLIVAAFVCAVDGCYRPTTEQRIYSEILAEFDDRSVDPTELDMTMRRFRLRARSTELKLNVHYVRGRFLQREKRWEDAVNAFRKCDAEEFLLRDFARFYQAQSEARQGRYAEAIEVFGSIAADFPEFPQLDNVRLAMGKAHAAAGQHQAALALFRTLLDDPDLGREARYLSGLAYSELSQPAQALAELQLVVESKTDDGLAADALKRIQELTLAHPSLSLSRLQQLVHGQVLAGQGDRAEARELWQSVAVGHSDKLATRARYEIGRALMRERDFGKAADVFELIVRSGHADYETRASYQRVLATRRMGQRTLALKRFRRFIRDYPGSSILDDVMMEYGWTLRDACDYAGARDNYDLLVRRFRKSDHAPEAAWFVAWCDIMLGRPGHAIASLQRVIDVFSDTDYAGRAYFWLGKMHERTGDHLTAADAYARVVERNTYYYRARAQERISALDRSGHIEGAYLKSLRQDIAKAVIPHDALRQAPSARIELMRKLHDPGAAVVELEQLRDRKPERKARIYYHLMEAYREAGRAYDSYIAAYRLSNLPEVRGDGTSSPNVVSQLLYPIPYEDILMKASEEFGVDPHYLAAMIREESRFNAQAVSWAGAYGLMQVMPATGKRIAKQLNMPHFETDMLLDPEVNIRFGAWYIRFLLDMFDGDFSMVSGAYNAGEGRMARWQARYGVSDPDVFIEQVPFDETRNHIKKVMHAYDVYRSLTPKTGTRDDRL